MKGLTRLPPRHGSQGNHRRHSKLMAICFAQAWTRNLPGQNFFRKSFTPGPNLQVIASTGSKIYVLLVWPAVLLRRSLGQEDFLGKTASSEEFRS